MNKLWLSIITATCLLAGNAAHADDHHGRYDWNRGYTQYHHSGDRGYYEHRRDHDRGDRDRREHWHHRDRDRRHFGPVVYLHPVYQRPAYYGYAYGGRDGVVHGLITFGF